MYLEKRQMLNFYLIDVFFISMLFYLFKKKTGQIFAALLVLHCQEKQEKLGNLEKDKKKIREKSKF